MTTLDGKWSYSYDKTGQLVGASFASSNPDVADRDLTYVYDKAGNRIQEIENGASAGYAVNEMNQYTQAGSMSYSYDDDGNLIEKTDGTSIWQYSYNDANRLIASTGPEGTVEYLYDGLGNLTGVIENGIMTNYLIDPAGTLYEVGSWPSGPYEIADWAGTGDAALLLTNGSNAVVVDLRSVRRH